jgi:hypothetical protein
MELEGSSPYLQQPATCPCPDFEASWNMINFLRAPRPTPKLQDHPFSTVRDCLFNTLAATLHIWMSFLHQQPENEPCCGYSDPLMTDARCYTDYYTGM